VSAPDAPASAIKAGPASKCKAAATGEGRAARKTAASETAAVEAAAATETAAAEDQGEGAFTFASDLIMTRAQGSGRSGMS
jgi:hypothetical protein